MRWDPVAGTIERDALVGCDAVVHLAGEGIATRRWNAAQKQKILRSRVDGTSLIATTLATLAPRPHVLVCASAIGIYGDRGDEVLDESAALGTGFLADVCRAWEAACAPARDKMVSPMEWSPASLMNLKALGFRTATEYPSA